MRYPLLVEVTAFGSVAMRTAQETAEVDGLARYSFSTILIPLCSFGNVSSSLYENYAYDLFTITLV